MGIPIFSPKNSKIEQISIRNIVYTIVFDTNECLLSLLSFDAFSIFPLSFKRKVEPTIG